MSTPHQAEPETTLPPAEIVLCEVRDVPLSVDEVLEAVKHPRCGGVGLFVGVVRDHDHGESVGSLDYTAHPSAVDVLREVCVEVAGDRELGRVAAVHRTGLLAVGDLAVVVGVSAPHRSDALAVCKELIDTLKERVPIWKKQEFVDGSDEWVGLS